MVPKPFQIIRRYTVLFILVTIQLAVANSNGNQTSSDPDDCEAGYRFQTVLEVPHTPIKNQGRSNACWTFATLSMIESELLRLGKEETDLSEMYIVRRAYPKKADNFVRLHGKAAFSGGGLGHDVLDMIRLYGLVPEEVYDGLLPGSTGYNHHEMDTVLRSMVNAVIQNKGRKLSPVWKQALESVLDVYLGTPPDEFEYGGEPYTPQHYFNSMIGIDCDDYIELTSFSHHPFYEKVRLELPDNWSCNDDYYNVPIDELEGILDAALKSGYSVVWDGDYTERDFSSGRSQTSYGTGYAVVPLKDRDEMSMDERKQEMAEPVAEKEITQALRDQAFFNYLTTDDHLMHIVGLAEDQNGSKYYLTKNSWGTDRKHNGYIYLSKSYMRLKTIAILLNKQALSKQMRKKLNL